MLIILSILVIITFITIIFFAFPQFSPIPYYPSNKKDLPLIIKALNLKNNQTIIDLGAGTGSIIFAAASEAYKKKLNTQFLAIDINPILILIMQLRRLFQPNKKNIKIVRDDMFKINLSVIARNEVTKQSQRQRLLLRHSADRNDIVFYLYISPWFLEKVIENCKLKIENFIVVSYMYPIPNLKPQKIFDGKNKIFLYKI